MSGDDGIKSNRSLGSDVHRGGQRNLIVELATVLPDGDPLRNTALPKGFPFLIDDDTHEVVEPALLFLVDTYLTKTGFWNRNTAKRAAYDLLDWWRFLDHHGRPWDLADGVDLDAYRDSMIGQISPRTHEEYKTETIRARRTSVRRFYAWAHKRGLCDGKLQEATEIREVYLSADRDPLAHIHAGPHRIAGDPGTPRSTRRPGEKVRPLIGGDPENPSFPRVAKHLGPLPSERGADDPTPSRDRLAAELSVSTGLRVDEVAKLTIFQILDLPVGGDAERFTTMHVTKTKRLVERDVNVPNYLIPDLHAYIDGERRECVAVARHYGFKKKSDEPKVLFLNGVNAHQSAGKPVSADTLSGAFRRAVIRAGLTERVTKTDPDTGEVRQVLVPQHRYHDLRHTYALWSYHALVRQGTSEPWKIIQSLLGHAHLSTTLDTYLRIVNIEKARTSDGAYEVMRSVIRGNSRAPRPTRFSRDSKAAIVDIDQARIETSRRIEKGTDHGKPFLRVVVPTPREPKPEQVIDLSFLYALPNLVDALAEAFLEWTATTQRAASRGGEAAHLRVGLVAFLVETGRAETTAEGLTTELANAFIGWLDEKRSGRNEPLQENSRAKLFGTLGRLIRHLRQLPKWSGRIPRDLYVRHSPWPMRHLKMKATEILASDDLRRLLSACAEEVTGTIQRIEEGWRRRDSARHAVPSSREPYTGYADLGVCLAALEAQLGGQILLTEPLHHSNRPLWYATRKLHGGVIRLGEYFYPTPRLLMPFVILLSLYTGVNTGSLVESQKDDFWVATTLGHRRFYWKVWKERAKSWQTGSIAWDQDVTHPARLVQFLIRWTEYLRPLVHPSASQQVFLFVPSKGKRVPISFQSKWGPLLSGSWAYSYDLFLKEHGLGRFDTRQFRVTGLEIVHQLTGGDLRAMQGWANHQRVGTTERSYLSDGAKRRDEERLAEIMQVRGRWRETQGKIETRGRPEHTDIGAATPGWTCLDPYSGLYGPKDTLCSAYAQCPVCPLGSIDFQSPYACVQAHNLLEAVRRAAETMAPQAWLNRMAPVQEKLLNSWLPQFPELVRREAEKLALPPLPAPE